MSGTGGVQSTSEGKKDTAASTGPAYAGTWEAKGSSGEKIVWIIDAKDSITMSVDEFSMKGVYTADISKDPASLDVTMEAGGEKFIIKSIMKMDSDDSLSVYASSDTPEQRPASFPAAGTEQAKDIIVFKKKK